MEWNKAWWLRISPEQIRKQQILMGEDNNHFLYARCTFNLSDGASCRILITANSRYRLYLNEKPILSGPCKGDQYRHYYDEIDLTEGLQKGKNVLAVQILYADWNRSHSLMDPHSSIIGLCTPTMGHHLCLEGKVIDSEGKELFDLTTGYAPWKFYFSHDHQLISREVNMNFGAVTEDLDFRRIPAQWKSMDFDDTSWFQPEKIHTVSLNEFESGTGQIPKLNLLPRPIPLLTEESGRLKEELGTSVFSNGVLQVPPGQSILLTFAAPELLNAYMNYHFIGGKGARITFTYIERIMDGDQEVPIYRWQVTDLTSHGNQEFQQDSILLSGRDGRFEPFWTRTFRILQIFIENGEEMLQLDLPAYRRTHYPLKVERIPKAEEPWKQKLFQICVNTLRNCMMDTYMDCPYYEQEQFIMDTRLQALFTYCLTDDAALPAKALEDFHCSMRPDGLIQGKYPSAFPEVISTFSLYYIFMILEYYQKTGDLSALIRYRADCDRILEYFNGKMDSSGMVGNPGYWPFVDWLGEWTFGVPNQGLKKPSATISFQYAYALKCAAEIAKISGRISLAEEYQNRQHQVLKAVYDQCWNAEEGLYREGPGIDQYSEHAQCWAVVNGIENFKSDQNPKSMIRNAFYRKDLLKCTFASSFELFKALQMLGLKEEQEQLLERWHPLIERDCTTCPEVPVGGRSACHAWSALPIYMLFQDQHQEK